MLEIQKCVCYRLFDIVNSFYKRGGTVGTHSPHGSNVYAPYLTHYHAEHTHGHDHAVPF